MECLFNTCSDNCCAYCKFHHCNITVRQMRAKNCLQKQCHHLIKNENHSYWKQREAMKKKRKERKQAINEYVSAFHGGM